jgi:hypothetical protein
MVTLTLLIHCGGAGIDRTFVVPMVTLTLSVVDGHVDTVDSCTW